jgi:hypothetical protein
MCLPPALVSDRSTNSSATAALQFKMDLVGILVLSSVRYPSLILRRRRFTGEKYQDQRQNELHQL